MLMCYTNKLAFMYLSHLAGIQMCSLCRLWVNRGHKGYTWCALQNTLNEICEMKAAFHGSLKLRRPLMVLDDTVAKVCSLIRTQPFNWELPKVLVRHWIVFIINIYIFFSFFSDNLTEVLAILCLQCKYQYHVNNLLTYRRCWTAIWDNSTLSNVILLFFSQNR